MEGGLDQTVERCASMLLSDDPSQIEAGFKLLRALRLSTDNASPELFSRFAQEVAAFQGGAVLRRLSLTRDVGQPDWQNPMGEHNRFLYATVVLCLLKGSRIVVDCILRDGTETIQMARADLIHMRLMAFINHTFKVSERFNSSPFKNVTLIQTLASLECLSNFARASKAFRAVMRESTEQRRIFEHFSDLLSERGLASSEAGSFHRLRLCLTCLAASFAFSEDSQLWAIDSGLLKLVAAIYEASPLRELSKSSQRGRSPVFRCNRILLRLLTADTTAEMLRGHNALEGFRPQKRKINAAEPEVAPWKEIEERLQGPTIGAQEEQQPEEIGNYDVAEAADIHTAMFSTPVVCSWNLCAAGREPVSGKRFSMCARCHVSRYCSKEHQKLHWRSQKDHCRKVVPRRDES